MSLINQMLRDLDSREAGRRGAASMPPAVPGKTSASAGTGRKAIVLLLIAVSLSLLFWFSPAGDATRSRLVGWLATPGPTPAPDPGGAPSGQVVRVLSAAPESQPTLLTEESTTIVSEAPTEVSLPVETAPKEALPGIEGDTARMESPGSTMASSGERTAESRVEVPAPPAEEAEEPPVAVADEVLPGEPVVETGRVERVSQPRQTGTPGAESEVVTPPAIRVTRVSSQETRESAEGAYRAAREQFEDGYPDEAERGLRHALTLDSAQHPARHLLSMLRYRQGDRQEAEALLREGIRITPVYAPFVVLLGRMLIESGATDEARRLLEQNLKITGDNPDLLSLLGSVYQQGGQFERAAAIYRRLLMERPADARVLAGLAIALDARGEHKEALDRYRAALGAGELPAAVGEYARQRVAALTSEH
ncbi:MAG: tetratricopeptide repeat protein [Sedimenticola sp.]|nr:tetratricopeptide repeat protein [Sedimenticola sp.]